MAAQIDKVISELRDMVLSGALQPGERVVELQFSARLGVAHAAAHRADGAGKGRPAGTAAVARACAPSRWTRSATRWTCAACWGMAARLLAERGAPGCWRSWSGGGGRPQLPARRDPHTTVDARAWGQINRRFHEILCEAAGNRALLSALEHNNKTPLAGPAALTLPSTPSLLETPFVLRAQADHEDLLRAITRREAVRAENLMREHAYRSRSACCWNRARAALLADASA